MIQSFGFVYVLLAVAFAQPPNLNPNHPDFKAAPTVSFERVYPNATPANYAISVESSGNAAYRSEYIGNEVRKEAAIKPYTLKFTVSEATSERIFQLARQANYFKSSPSAANSAPNPGTITLTYAEGPVDSFGQWTNGVRNSLTYNNSANPAIRQLRNIFEGISNTIQLGRQLEYLRGTSHSALNAALKRAEDSARNHGLIELQAIVPALKDVADDPSLSRIARGRAQHLLILAQSSSSH